MRFRLPHGRPLIEELEPRILYSADLAPGFAAAPAAPVAEYRPLEDAGTDTVAAQTQQANTGSVEVVVVDARVDNADSLLESIVGDSGRRIEVVRVDVTQDGLRQLGWALSGYHDVAAVHILAHGDAGRVLLGDSWIDSETLARRADDLMAWGVSLTADADILVYGCNVAEGDAGRDFVALLAGYTGADVAASTNLTGSTALVGDWALEVETGPIETRTISSATWAGALGDQFLVNTTTADGQDTEAYDRGSQNAVAADAAGNFVVVWNSNGEDGSGWGVYARIFYANGGSSAEFRVNQTTANHQYFARVAADAAGHFVVTWTSYPGQDGDVSGVYWRRFDMAGTALSGEMRANTTTAGEQFNSVVAMNTGTGDFVLAWEGQGTGDSQGIWFRRYDANGNPIDATERPAHAATTNNETNSTVAMDSTGRFVIAFERDEGSKNHIYFQRFDATGTAAGGLRQVDNSYSNSTGPAIAMDGAGNFTLVYREQSTLRGVWGRSYLADGSDPNGYANYFKVDGSLLSDTDATSPSIAMAADGSFAVTYEKSGSNGIDIYARRYNANGTAADSSAFVVNQSTAGDQHWSSAVPRGPGSYIVVWSGAGTGDSSGVFARSVGNLAPTITSNGGGAAATVPVAENRTYVTTVTATDADIPAQTLSYSIAGGADAARFSIGAATGVLSFVAPPDFEAPGDANGDNVYEVIVRVSDGNGGIDEQALNVVVTDVANQLVVTTTDDVVDGDTTSVEALNANPGADGQISLREAVLAANATSGADVIVLPAGTYRLTRSGSESDNAGSATIRDLDVTGALTIQGAGGGATAVDGNGIDRVFQVRAAATLTLRDLTVQGGVSSSWGGGILVDAGGTLNLDRVTISGNSAGSGGGIYSYGALTATDSTIAGNTAPDWGGGLYNDGGSVTLERATLAGNTAGKEGGGIYNTGSGALLTLRNVTASGNVATGKGGAIWTNRDMSAEHVTIAFNSSADAGGGIHKQGSPSVTLADSIVAANSAPSAADISGSVTNVDVNLIGGTAASVGLDSALVMNGGATATHALLAGSPAIDAASAGALTTDQRGAARVGAPDIGAYEYTGAIVNAMPATDDVYATGAEDLPSIAITLTGSDVDGTVTHFRLTSLPANGQLYADAALTTLAVAGTDYAATGQSLTLYFVPAADWNGVTTFQYAAQDDQGGLDPTPATATLTVTPVNDAPVVAQPIADQNATQNAPFVFTIPAGSFTDVDAGDTLTYSAAGGPPWLSFDAGTRTFSGTPGSGDIGSWTITVRATDGSGAYAEDDFLLTVGNINDAPQGADRTVTTQEDTPYVFGLTDFGFADPNDSPANNLLAVRIASLPGAGSLTLNGVAVTAGQTVSAADIAAGRLIFTPAANANGAGYASFGFQVQDDGGTAHGGTDLDPSPNTLTIDVTPVNDAPILDPVGDRSVNEGEELRFTVTASDIDSATLTYSLAGAPAGADIDPDTGVFTWTPTEAQGPGSYTFDIVVRDGSLSDRQTITVTVHEVNAAPVITSNGGGASASVTVAENTTAVTTVTAADADIPAQTLTYAIAGGADADKFVIDATTGELSFVTAPDHEHPADADGDNVYEVIVRVSDGSLSDGQTMNVAVVKAGVAPVLASGAAVTVGADGDSAAPLLRTGPSSASSTSAQAGNEAAPDLAAGGTPASFGDDPGSSVLVAMNRIGDGGASSATWIVRAETPSGTQRRAMSAATSLLQIRVALSDDARLRSLDILKQELQSERYGRALDEMREAIERQETLENIVAGASVAVSGSLSVGYVLWLLRGGALVGSLLSALPAWTVFDPLPVLAYKGRDDDGEKHDDATERMFDKKSRARRTRKPKPAAGTTAGSGIEQ